MLLVKNINEQLIWEKLNEILPSVDLVCKCEKCKADIYAYTLNELKPRYATTKKGEELVKKNVVDLQLYVDMLTTINRAIQVVSGSPRHVAEGELLPAR